MIPKARKMLQYKGSESPLKRNQMQMVDKLGDHYFNFFSLSYPSSSSSLRRESGESSFKGTNLLLFNFPL